MKRFAEIRQRLYEQAAAHDWRGIDPFDGLTAPLARWLPGKFARQAWTQLHRRSPINLRPLCGIRPQLNSTTLALFALGSGDERVREVLRAVQNPDGGWGYPFPWQSRAFLAPAHTSNLICTVLAAKALNSDPRTFIEGHLLRDGWITYIPDSDTQVHNINLLGAVACQRPECVAWSARRQRPDGSWPYGEAPNQQWRDNFHTAYCLIALREYQQTTGDSQFATHALRGFAWWERVFWRPDGAPRYYHDRDWPVDIHCCAAGILTYLAFDKPERAHEIAAWTINHLWDGRGFFWHQLHRGHTTRICYLRWGQAWMYWALSRLLRAAAPAHT